MKQVRRVEGVAEAGPIGLSNASVPLPSGEAPLDVALVGVEPGEPGTPELLAGSALRNRRGSDVIIDDQLAAKAGVGLGDTLTITTVQGDEEEAHELRIAGLIEERQYFFQPTIFVPMATWDEIRPKPQVSTNSEAIANVFAVKLIDPSAKEVMAQRIAATVEDVDVADKPDSCIDFSETGSCFRENTARQDLRNSLSLDQEILLFHAVADRINQFSPLDQNRHTLTPL